MHVAVYNTEERYLVRAERTKISVIREKGCSKHIQNLTMSTFGRKWDQQATVQNFEL